MKVILSLVVSIVLLTGCGVASIPCRVVAGGLSLVPVVGSTAAQPAHACAAAM